MKTDEEKIQEAWASAEKPFPRYPWRVAVPQEDSASPSDGAPSRNPVEVVMFTLRVEPIGWRGRRNVVEGVINGKPVRVAQGPIEGRP